MTNNQIILTGTTTADLVELFRPMVQQELQRMKDDMPEKLLSPAEACKVFQPSISKPTLLAWSRKGLLNEFRIGGRCFYKQSQILEKLTTIKRYKN